MANYVSSTPGSVVKSIQRGTTSLAIGQTTLTTSITSVDLTKAFLIYDGCRTDDTTFPGTQCDIRLTSATVVTTDRVASTNTVLTSWHVVEYF